MYIILTEEDKELIKTDFEAWEKKRDIAGCEYYNGNAYAIFKDSECICYDCFKANVIEGYIDLDDLDCIDFREEGSILICESCNKLIHPNHYVCGTCGEMVEDQKNDCCKEDFLYISGSDYEF